MGHRIETGVAERKGEGVDERAYSAGSRVLISRSTSYVDSEGSGLLPGKPGAGSRWFPAITASWIMSQVLTFLCSGRWVGQRDDRHRARGSWPGTTVTAAGEGRRNSGPDGSRSLPRDVPVNGGPTRVRQCCSDCVKGHWFLTGDELRVQFDRIDPEALPVPPVLSFAARTSQLSGGGRADNG